MTYTGLSSLRVDITDGVAHVVIDNPPINLFDRVLYREMLPLVKELAADDSVRSVVLSSANDEFFIAHFDVELIARMPQDMPAPLQPNDFQMIGEMLRTMPKATICAVRGRVGGGGAEIAASADIVFASPDSVFCQPEVPLGIIPGGGGTARLSRTVGRHRAMEIVLAGEDIDANTAEKWGWINRVMADPVQHALAMATRIATFPPQAVAAGKRLVLMAETGVEENLVAEGTVFGSQLSDPRARAAMEQFLARGGQTRDGELRLGNLAGEINEGDQR